jgi:sugar lactone lactonase YvrE
MITSRSVVVGCLAIVACGAASCADPPALGVASETIGAAASPDSLFIGDTGDNTVKRCDVMGPSCTVFTQPTPPPTTIPPDDNDPLTGVRGLVFRPGNAGEDGDLLVVSQNITAPNTTPKNGEIFQYQGFTGAFVDDLVKDEQQFAPFIPRGIVLADDNILYVADFGNPFTPSPTFTPPATAGRLARYDGTSGAFLGDLDLTHLNGPFFPRGVVFGPDGKLYVSNFTDPANNKGGQILRFNPRTGRFVDVFVDGATCSCHKVTGCDPVRGCDLTRPEGLVFSPDGRLYVTSFRQDTADNDKILVFNTAGNLVDQIDLDVAGQARAFAQAILFGPAGRLFVPITGNGPATGSVRSYDVTTHNFDTIIQPSVLGGPLKVPLYLTFCNTDPGTLAYHEGPSRCPTH